MIIIYHYDYSLYIILNIVIYIYIILYLILYIYICTHHSVHIINYHMIYVFV